MLSNLSVDGNTVEATVAQVLQEVAGVGVDGDGLLLEGRDLGDEVHSALALLFLELERDAADGSTLDALHQVGDVAGNHVAQSLGWDHSNLVAHLQEYDRPEKKRKEKNRMIEQAREKERKRDV